jgi:CheY-like chemotaxis protein
MREQPAADSLSGWRVLLADDEPALLELISRKLGGLGCQVTAAENGYQAWSFFKRSPQCFDLVLTDYDMPEMTGAELASVSASSGPSCPSCFCPAALTWRTWTPACAKHSP